MKDKKNKYYSIKSIQNVPLLQIKINERGWGKKEAMKNKKNYVVYIMQDLHLVRIKEYTNRVEFMSALEVLQNALGVVGIMSHVEIKEGETCVLGFVGLV